MIHLYLLFFSLLPLALVGILLPGAAGSRRGMAFGVSLPLDVAGSPEVKVALERFRLRCRLSTGAIGAVLAVVLGFPPSKGVAFAPLAGVLVALALVVTFWTEERREVRKLAMPTPVVRTAELASRGFRLWPAIAGGLALLPPAAAAVWLSSHWEQLPQTWPRHWDVNGAVNGWGHRSATVVYGPLATGVGAVLLVLAATSMIGFAPGPERSRRQGMVVPMVLLTWGLSLSSSLLGLLPVLGPVSAADILFGTAAFSLALVGLVLWGLKRSGMLRAGNTPPTLPAYDGTPDAGWRGGGLIYYNPSDAAVLVSKRLGVGWTLNFARPLAWIYLAGLVAFVAGISIFAARARSM